MKKWTKILLIIVIVILLLFVGMSYFIGTQVFMGSTQLVTCEDTSKVKDSFWERYNMDYDVFCSTYTIEKVEITSTFDEHMIPADYIYALGEEGDKNNPTVILVHGLGGNRYTNYPLAEMFLQKGYNVLTYDQRSSNENTAQYTTFGYWEKYDLIDYIDYVYSHAPEQVIGIWGTSFGGATAGLAMGDKDVENKVDFLILDCPVSDMKWMVEEEMRKKAVVQMAIGTISYSELEAVEHIFEELDGKEGLLVASKIADRVGITRSVIVNALRKFESAGVIESRSLGMKGTHIKILNDKLMEELKKLKNHQ